MNHLQYSIEYSHIYTNEVFSNKHALSVLLLKSILEKSFTHNLCVMVDDYSPSEETSFDYNRFLSELKTLNAVPQHIIFESQLLIHNKRILDQTRSTKVGRSLASYIDRKEKHPCSLFIASWYLIRLGYMRNNWGILPAEKLINILNESFLLHERKALPIIKAFTGENLSHKINNYYIK